MAARVLFQRRSTAPLAALALASLALTPATARAESPAEVSTDQRKPIYDDVYLSTTSSSLLPATKSLPASQQQKLVEDGESRPARPTPTDRLAVQIGRARVFLHRYAVAVEDRINATMDSAFHLEQSFTDTVASLAPPRGSGERLMPGAIYVLVAAMAGTIMTRNRNFILRATVPLALGVGAGWAVLPLTMRNVSDLSWRYEQRFPAVADAHVKLREGIQDGIRFAKVRSEQGVRYVDNRVTDAREAVEGWVKQGK
ncbi:hypothetical protein L249_4206 [Ophiocordyceps polyrhachis-furcata BCC 54312]|uniref:MICOS complex subunit n=1 Tax=Ophiocordyceps polyrhachis-furcata BCC 54312 TaxID=1330021 RepID=A0A367LBV0_9HYPO|nr:hypothetical protein L249_4206 [Ophiocordyceps polyrhachis-furcata BCC 54312]